MARTEEGIKLLKEKAIELDNLKKVVAELAEENEFSLPEEDGGYYELYKDWHNSSCYGEESGEDFGISEGKVWYPSSC